MEEEEGEEEKEEEEDIGLEVTADKSKYMLKYRNQKAGSSRSAKS
jgi:hypothetical protein